MRNGLFTGILAAAFLSACAPNVPELSPTERQRPANFPEQDYLQAAKQGRTVFQIDPVTSIVVIEVYRGGTLARVGHDHVVASHDIQGYVLRDAGRADLYVALDRLVVDEPALRADAGFDTQPSPEDIAGTRRNMLTRELEAERYPFAMIRAGRIDSGDAGPTAEVAVTLHGVTRSMRVPVRIDADADDMDVSGRLALRQTDFGIVPLSVMGGAVQVKDEVDLRFRIHAQRLR